MSEFCILKKKNIYKTGHRAGLSQIKDQNFLILVKKFRFGLGPILHVYLKSLLIGAL